MAELGDRSAAIRIPAAELMVGDVVLWPTIEGSDRRRRVMAVEHDGAVVWPRFHDAGVEIGIQRDRIVRVEPRHG